MAVGPRIGDGRSTWDTGIVSAVNARGVAMGGRVGMTAQELVRHVLRQGRG